MAGPTSSPGGHGPGVSPQVCLGFPGTPLIAQFRGFLTMRVLLSLRATRALCTQSDPWLSTAWCQQPVPAGKASTPKSTHPSHRPVTNSSFQNQLCGQGLL